MTVEQHKIVDTIKELSTGKTAVERSLDDVLSDWAEWVPPAK